MTIRETEERRGEGGGGPRTTLGTMLDTAAAVNDADDDSAADADDEAFASWCRSVGIWIHPSLRCSSAVDVGGRGVIVKSGCSIEAGDVLVRVPREWVFSLGRALVEADDVGERDGGEGAFRAAVLERRRSSAASSSSSSLCPLTSSPEALLACFLLFETWKVEERDKVDRSGLKGGGAGATASLSQLSLSPPSPRSRWEPYLRSLPTSYPLLMQTVSSSEGRGAVARLFAGIPAATRAAEEAAEEVGRGDVAEAAAELVARAASGAVPACRSEEASASASSFARSRWPWARATVRSRSMFLRHSDDFTRRPPPPSSDSSPPLAPLALESSGALLPFGDLFNHAHSSPPEEPDTGGSCEACRGWHGSGCDASRGAAASGSRGRGATEGERGGATEGEGGGATEGESVPSPLAPPPSWGDGTFDAGSSHYVVTSRRRRDPETQVFLTYSTDASNLSTLRDYGFVDDRNPHDRAPVALLAWEKVADVARGDGGEETAGRGDKGGKGDKKKKHAATSTAAAAAADEKGKRQRRWRSEALKLLLTPYPSSCRLSEAESWFHSLSGAPGWRLLAALRSAFLSTEAAAAAAPSSCSSRPSPSPSMSQRRAAVASGASPGAEVDAAVFSAIADAARVAREMASAGEAEQQRIDAMQPRRQRERQKRERERYDGDDADEKTVVVSEGLLAAAAWRRAWLCAMDRAMKHASRVAGAADFFAEAGREK